MTITWYTSPLEVKVKEDFQEFCVYESDNEESLFVLF